MQTNYELNGERLERLEGIFHSHERALLSQERKLREVEEGSKKIGGDLQVQAQRVEDWDPTSRQGTFSVAGSDGLGASAGEFSISKAPQGSSETSACEASSQEGVGGAARRSPGD